jgi:dienelactone hydrolase
MTARIRSVDYAHAGTQLRGEFAWNDEWTKPRPCIVVIHDAMKSDQGFEEERAVTLAGLGFPAFALDVYGAGVNGRDEKDAQRLMAPFMADRRFLRDRLLCGLEAARALPEVDGDRMAAIGYCFGGLCALDLARANAPLAGVASFHGLLSAPDTPLGDPAEAPILPSVLVLHGWDDSWVQPEALAPFADEMNARAADWQLTAFGRTGHAFTNMRYARTAAGPDGYSAIAAQRAWRIFLSFLAELFPEGPDAPAASPTANA